MATAIISSHHSFPHPFITPLISYNISIRRFLIKHALLAVNFAQICRGPSYPLSSWYIVDIFKCAFSDNDGRKDDIFLIVGAIYTRISIWLIQEVRIEEAYFDTLTHWGRVTHICVGNLTIIGSDNGLSPGRRQAIIWANAGILLIGPLGTNLSEILVKIYIFSFRKCIWKCRLENGGHLVSASMCYRIYWYIKPHPSCQTGPCPCPLMYW